MYQKIKSLSAMVFSAEEKIKIVKFWCVTRSFVSVKHSFRREYDCNASETPYKDVISRIVHHFEKEGTVHGKNQVRSGRSPVVTGRVVLDSDFQADSTLTHLTIQVTQL